MSRISYNVYSMSVRISNSEAVGVIRNTKYEILQPEVAGG